MFKPNPILSSPLVTLLLVLLAAPALVVADRTITVYNGCPFTVWPALYTVAGSTSQSTGWAAEQYTAVTFTTSEDWTGRIWPRRDCDFSSGSTVPSACLTGGCNGGLQCDKIGGTGVPPSNIAELAFNQDGTDFYDINAADGTTLPMSIYSTAGCAGPKCLVDINQSCPQNLSVKDPNGFTVGCLSACAADPTNESACCTGSHNTPGTCPASGVPDYAVCNGACPDYICYAFDDGNGRLFSCPTVNRSLYTVTFCPPN
ncbi:Osmotin thaumatin-like protein [Meredithblackwellia eburnea MCA 4105]